MDSAPIVQKISHLIAVISVLAEKAIYYTSSCQKLSACVNLLRPLFEELQEKNSPLTVEDLSTLNMLEFVCLKIKELLDSCAGKGSKSSVVLRKEKIFKSFQELSTKLRARLMSLPLESYSLSAHSKELVDESVNLLLSAEFQVDRVEEYLSEEVGDALGEIRKGAKLRHGTLMSLAGKLGLGSNQEILKEASLLEKEKNTAHLSKDKGEEELLDLLIILMTQMSDDLAEQKQLQAQDGKSPPIPADFRCPLSLELMSDPVIVASGQTYERAYIQQWLDEGIVTCPKSRQPLNHLNLISNFTVKALITNWCEQNGVPLPEPKRLQRGQHDSGPVHESGYPLLHAGSIRTSPSRTHDDVDVRIEGSEVGSFDENRGILHGLAARGEEIPRNGERNHSRNASTSSRGSSFDEVPVTGDMGYNVSSMSNDLCDFSEELSRLALASASASPYNEEENGSPASMSYHGSLSRGRQVGGALSETSRNGHLAADTAGEDDDDIELKVQALVEDLHSSSGDTQRNAATELRLLAKYNVENRITIANCGAIPPLVSLLHSTDPQIQENAVTALLNLSINNNNKSEIAHADAIGPLVEVLKVGTSEARENAAATLFSLSVMDENKITIGQSGAIEPLVDLLNNGTPRGKKDAATALFNLSIYHENKIRIVRANAVKPLVKLMSDPAAGMVDKAVAVLANLATIQDGRVSIGQEDGIPALVEVVEMGSVRGKENAAAALLHLCTNSNRFRTRVLQEGAIPPLVALAKSGTPRAKEKASALLRLFREQRHGRGAGDMHGDRR